MKTIKIVIFAIVIAWPFVNDCSGENSTTETQIKLSGEEYWYSTLQGGDKLKDIVKHENGAVTGMYLTRHGYVPFEISRKEIEDPKSKTQGYIYYGNYNAFWLAKDTKSEFREVSKQQLKKITGLDFNSREDWEFWVNKNRPHLQFSEKEGRLIVINPAGDKSGSQK